MVARALADGLMTEDRVVILEDAKNLAQDNIRKYPNNKHVLSSYANVGIELYKYSNNQDALSDAMKRLKDAENHLGDPEISQIIRRIERRLSGSHGDWDVEEA